jgi:thiosulfate dehydrogenase [quinone] large subunit
VNSRDTAASRWLALPAARGRAVTVLVLRYLMGLFFTFAAANKFQRDYLFSDYLQGMFEQRLTELDPASFGAAFLQNFGIPYYAPIAWIVAWGELAVAVGLLLGLLTRVAAGLALFLMFMFGIGGYYDASLIPLCLIALMLALVPSGRWLGLDRRLHRENPGAWWFG